MKPFELRESVVLDYQGERIFAVQHLPLGVENPPLVVFCHGFAGHKAGDWRLYVRESEMLSKVGIASLRFDFRGCGDSEGRWIDMTIGRQVSDLMVVLSYVDQLDTVDTNRIGILGKSLGGLVAVIGAETYGNIKSMALWAPAFHAEQWRKLMEVLQDPATPDEMRKEIMQFDGAHANEHFLQEFFALKLEEHLVHLNETPLLHIHGLKDNKIDLTHAAEYERIRQKAKANTHLVRLPNSDHEFGNFEEQAHVLEETCKWFVETL